MSLSDSSDPTPAALAHYPPAIRAAHARFVSTGDPAAADQVVLAIVTAHLPSRWRRRAEPLREAMRLAEDLGLDSLAVAEIVFLVEDLYGIRIQHADLQRLATVGELRAFVRTSLAGARRSTLPVDRASSG